MAQEAPEPHPRAGTARGEQDPPQAHGAPARRRLLRSDINAVADNPTELLIASPAWGFGPIGYGPYRTARMLDTPNVDGIVADIVEATHTGGAGAGFAELFKPSGAGQVFGLGVAMGTKLLYFASRARPVPGAQPLVYDQWVYAAITQLSENEEPRLDGAPLPNPKRWVSRRAYEAWCEWAAHRADEHRVAPDDIEFALFAYGNPALS